MFVNDTVAFSGGRNTDIGGTDLTDYIGTDLVLVGDCPTGVDAYVRGWCEIHGYEYRVYHADWGKHGRAAGPIRNRAMIRDADRLVAFWDGRSRGTKNAIDEALRQRVDVMVRFR